MSELLTTIGFSANDGVQAEHLCDFIFLLNKRVKRGHCLLVAAGDTHSEMREKVKIAAEVAFESVEMINGPAVASNDKNVRVNKIFNAAAEHIFKAYRMPWLWLEPDCVPLEKGWLDKIEDKYFNQPKRYCGSFFMGKDAAAKDLLFMARVACYPQDAFEDLKTFLAGAAPFNYAAGPFITPKATKTRLVQETAVVDASMKLSAEAVMVHHDKNSVLLTKLRDQAELNLKKK